MRIAVVEPKVKGRQQAGIYAEQKQASHTTRGGKGKIARLKKKGAR